jgi:copper chaperone CopZ
MKTTIELLNLKCGGCANSIKKGLLAIEGIHEVSVDIEHSLVAVDVMNDATLNLVKNKLSGMGYPEVGDANNLFRKAKSFVSCAGGRLISEN